MALIQGSAARVHDWVAAQTGDPLDMLRRIKFEPVGRHPVEDRPLNLVEQINQTWTYAVAAAAARQPLLLHPDAGGFHLAPGAHMARELDIMSKVPGLVFRQPIAKPTATEECRGHCTASHHKDADRCGRCDYAGLSS